MPGEFGEGTHPEGDKTVSQEGEQGLYQPETLQNGGTGSSDPDQPDVAAAVSAADRDQAESDRLQPFTKLAEQVAREIVASGGRPLDGSAKLPLLRALEKAYNLGESKMPPDMLSGSEGRALSDDFSLAEIDEGAGSEDDGEDYTDV
jgi:hypothetical protein